MTAKALVSINSTKEEIKELQTSIVIHANANENYTTEPAGLHAQWKDNF